MPQFFQKRLAELNNEHEKLIRRKNEKICQSNGVFHRYEFPILTAAHTPLTWRYDLNPFTNPFLLGAVVVTTILQLMLVYVPPLRAFFDTYYLDPIELAICFGFSALMFVWIELEKLFIGWRSSK